MKWKLVGAGVVGALAVAGFLSMLGGITTLYRDLQFLHAARIQAEQQFQQAQQQRQAAPPKDQP